MVQGTARSAPVAFVACDLRLSLVDTGRGSEIHCSLHALAEFNQVVSILSARCAAPHMKRAPTAIDAASHSGVAVFFSRIHPRELSNKGRTRIQEGSPEALGLLPNFH